MRKIRIFLAVLVLVLGIAPMTAAAEEDAQSAGCLTLQARQALQEDYGGTAEAAILYEMDSQTLVCAIAPDRKINPTGLVKIMTTLVALEEGTLDDTVTVKQSVLNAVSASAKRLGLKSGDVLTVRDLLYCVMLQSANDAAVVLADHIAGSQADFVAKMNARAATLGCTNTFFADVNGLDDANQYSTARDLAKILAAAMENPTFVEIFTAVNHWLPNTVSCTQELTTNNAMCREGHSAYDARVLGGRPAAATSSDRSFACVASNEKGRYLCVLISVTDKSSSYAGTFRETSKLLDVGFHGYALQQVLDSEQPYCLYTVANGENSVVVSSEKAVYALLPVDFDREMLRFRDVADTQALVAPLRAGTPVAKLQVFYGEIVVTEVSLLARHDVAVLGTTIRPSDTTQTGLFGRVLKWALIALAVTAVVASLGLLTIRQVNILRYRKKHNDRRSGKREEHEK